MYDLPTIGRFERVLYKRNLRDMKECPTSATMPESIFVTAEVNGAALIYQDWTGERTCLGMSFDGHCKLLEIATLIPYHEVRAWVEESKLE